MRLISLNQNELEALRILWEQGELKPAEIQARFAWPIDNGTLRSVLVNLVRKKHITRKLRGKAFLYAAQVPKTTLLQSFLAHMAQVFAGGSHRELVMQLLETGDIKPADLALLRQTAGDPRPTKAKKEPQ